MNVSHDAWRPRPWVFLPRHLESHKKSEHVQLRAENNPFSQEELFHVNHLLPLEDEITKTDSIVPRSAHSDNHRRGQIEYIATR